MNILVLYVRTILALTRAGRVAGTNFFQLLYRVIHRAPNVRGSGISGAPLRWDGSFRRCQPRWFPGCLNGAACSNHDFCHPRITGKMLSPRVERTRWGRIMLSCEVLRKNPCLQHLRDRVKFEILFGSTRPLTEHAWIKINKCLQC